MECATARQANSATTGNEDDFDGCSNTCEEEIKGGTSGTPGTGDETGDPGSTTDEPGSTSTEPGSTRAATTAPGTSATADGGDGDTGDTDDAGAADDSGGCGCTSGNDSPPGWAWLGVFALGLVRRRRSAMRD